jgi:hypothetical protein
MKYIQFLTFTFLTAISLFQAPGARADGANNGAAINTFTKWIVAPFNPTPALFANLGGVVGGDVGEGVFTGEALTFVVVDSLTTIEAIYRFDGTKHSFTAAVHVEQIGANAVIVGVVTEGWLKGHAVQGEYTAGTCEHDGPLPDCFEGTLEIIKSRSKD